MGLGDGDGVVDDSLGEYSGVGDIGEDESLEEDPVMEGVIVTIGGEGVTSSD